MELELPQWSCDGMNGVDTGIQVEWRGAWIGWLRRFLYDWRELNLKDGLSCKRQQ